MELLAACFLMSVDEGSGVLTSTKCHCRRWNQGRVHNEVSAERPVVQSQQCCYYVDMGRIIQINLPIF